MLSCVMQRKNTTKLNSITQYSVKNPTYVAAVVTILQLKQTSWKLFCKIKKDLMP